MTFYQNLNTIFKEYYDQLDTDCNLLKIENIEGTIVTINQEQALENMEAILNQAAMGIHVLFDKESIAAAYKEVTDENDFYDFDKVKVIQDSMTELISRKSYFENLE